MADPPVKPTYTCREYRLEMTLLGLERQLQEPDLPEERKKVLRKEALRLRQQLGME